MIRHNSLTIYSQKAAVLIKSVYLCANSVEGNETNRMINRNRTLQHDCQRECSKDTFIFTVAITVFFKDIYHHKKHVQTVRQTQS